MPNHVESDFWVKGKGIAEFQEFAKEGDNLLSANKFIPYPDRFAQMDKEYQELGTVMSANYGDVSPEEVKKRLVQYKKKWGTDSDGYNAGGYEWCNANWGTKWGIYDVELIHQGKNSVRYAFRSAWSPPIPVIFAMSQKFPNLEFTLKYYEAGSGFQGVFKVKAGEVLLDENKPYHGSRGG